jgi:hypothetical protein
MALATVDAAATAPNVESPSIAKVTFRIELSIILELQCNGIDLNAG